MLERHNGIQCQYDTVKKIKKVLRRPVCYKGTYGEQPFLRLGLLVVTYLYLFTASCNISLLTVKYRFFTRLAR